MSFLSIFLVSLMPILKVLFITVVGLFLATHKIDLLGPSARNHLNNLVFYVFAPSIIGSRLAAKITLDDLLSLWFMPVNMLLTLVIGSLFGWVVVKVTRTPKHLRGLIIGCCSAGNQGNLLLIILPALCEESHNSFGDPTSCAAYGEAYAVFSLALLAIYFWTYVYFIMRVYAAHETEDISENDPSIIDIPAETSDSAIINVPAGTSDKHSDNCSKTVAFSQGQSGQDPEGSSIKEEPPGVRTSSKLNGNGFCSAISHSFGLFSGLFYQVPILEKTKKSFKHLSKKINLKTLFVPSTIAAIIGFFIGIVSPIRKILIGNNAPLRVIYSSASLIGDAAIPAITLILGANLLKGLRGSGASVRMVIGIIVVRFILLPPIGVFVVKWAHRFGIVGSNSLYRFTLMLQYAVPPAMNVGTISQLLKAGTSECSVIMLWSYVVSIAFLTLWSAFFIWLVT